MLLVLSNKRKGMPSSSEQPLVGEKRYVTTLITAAKETIGLHVILGMAWHFFFVTNSENLCFAGTFLLQLPLSLLEVPNIRRRNKNRHFTIAACLESVMQGPSLEMTST